MYVILVSEDNMLSTTIRQRIMQRSKLVDDLWFLVSPKYNGHNMDDYTVILEYLLPISKKYCTEILEKSDEKYEGYLKYLLPVDTTLTAEHGDIEIQLSFIYSDIDDSGKSVQRVRKTSKTIVQVLPISAWSDIIPDSALTSLDQRIIKIDAQIRALNDMNNAMYETKADSLIYDESSNALQLAAVGKAIGNKVTLNSSYESFKDGVPVVDFTTISEDVDTPSEDDNIVEF